MSSRIPTPLSHFIYFFFKWVIAPKGSSLTHLQLRVRFFHLKLKTQQGLLSMCSKTFGVFFPPCCWSSFSVKLFDMYTRIKSPNASCAAPVCYANGGVFLMKASWIIHERCSTRGKTRRRNTFVGKELLWKNKNWRFKYLCLPFDIQGCSSFAY